MKAPSSHDRLLWPPRTLLGREQTNNRAELLMTVFAMRVQQGKNNRRQLHTEENADLWAETENHATS